jgi:3-dehydroquinate dehydratase II
MRIAVIHGANLDRLGRRQPDLYGRQSLAELNAWLEEQRPEADLLIRQVDDEGSLLAALREAEDHCAGVVINPAGHAHTSVVLLDALLACPLPVIEVHLSNVHAREPFRRRLLSARGVVGVISGLGAFGYLAAVDWHLQRLRELES